MLAGYYRPRWALQGATMLSALASGKPADWATYNANLLAFEQAFSAATSPTYPVAPVGAPLALAAAALRAWAGGSRSDWLVLEDTDVASPAPLFSAWTTDEGALLTLCAAAPGCSAVNSGGGIFLAAAQRVARPGTTLFVRR